MTIVRPAMLGLLAILHLSACASQTQVDAPPNVLFISVDDMNDWVGHLGGYEGTVHTPNIDRLATDGVAFTNAHAPASVCNPSRTAIFTGLRPSTTGIYENNQWLRPHLPEVVTLPSYFKNAGYYVAGGGKNFHHNPGFNPPDQWDEYFDRGGFHEGADPWPPNPPVAGVNDFRFNFDFGPVAAEGTEMADVRVAEWAAEFLNRSHDRPFFLAPGIFRPHLRWYVPQRYFDMYPLDEIELPRVLSGDLDDVPPAGREMAGPEGEHAMVVQKGKWKEAVQAYLASITYADEQVGRVLEALRNSRYADNTIVVLWSDHGYHLGEKEHWHKFTLWERSTKVPFIMVVPGLTEEGTTSSRPVNLLDLYPTLIELAGLEEKPDLDGVSLVPLLKNPAAERSEPSISTHLRGNHAVRSDRWRYIIYANGDEELYDHQTDPNEWTNLAGKSEFENVVSELRRWVPATDAPGAPAKNAYAFDEATYTWVSK